MMHRTQKRTYKTMVTCFALLSLCPVANAQWNTLGSDIYNTNSGNVGIGTVLPISKFQVTDGDINLESTNPMSVYTPSVVFSTQSNTGNQAVGSVWGRTSFNGDKWIELGTSPNNALMSIENNGNVGIGVAAPSAKLHIDGVTGAAFKVTETGNPFPWFCVDSRKVGINVAVTSWTQTTLMLSGVTGTTYLDIVNGATTGFGSQIRFIDPFTMQPRHAIVDDLSSNMMIIYPNMGGCSEVMTIKGKLLLGSPVTPTPAGYTLYATEGILTEKVKVAVQTTADWSDFVFDKSYKLPTLRDVETFIDNNQHLPGVPSADEVVCEGIDLGKMDAKLLQKVEELTLYVLQLQKQNEEQQKVIEGLVVWSKK